MSYYWFRCEECKRRFLRHATAKTCLKCEGPATREQKATDEEVQADIERIAQEMEDVDS